MAEQLPKPFMPQRHAHDTAKRVFETLDYLTQFNPRPMPGDLWIPETYYQIDPSDLAAATAHLVVRRPRETGADGKIKPYSLTREGHFEMGYYDPARESWVVYDDVVSSPDERSQLESHFTELAYLERTMLESWAAQDEHFAFYDYQHPATREMRSHTRAILARSGLLAGLLHNSPDPLIRNGFRFDQHSSAYICVAPNSNDVATYDILKVAYKGLIRPGKGNIERQSLFISVAQRQRGRDEWVPNRPLMQQHHWDDHLFVAAELLEAERKRFPAFSLARCAMTLSGTQMHS